MFCEEITIEEGSPCPECATPVVAAPSKNCSCHISPPCTSCVEAGYECPSCHWSDSTYEPPEPEPYVHKPRYEAGSRRYEQTSTYTANPFNSTPFTRCCNTESLGPRCENCQAEILHHDDGLSARRREVGAGNCLMCGKKRGPIHITGNCHC